MSEGKFILTKESVLGFTNPYSGEFHSVEGIVHEYIRDNLTFHVETGERQQYDYSGKFVRVKTFRLLVELGEDTLADIEFD